MRVTGYAIELDVIAACACLLGLIALVLLYRYFLLGRQTEQLRQQLEQEKLALRHAEQALIEARTHLSQALAAQDRTREAERQRIARDLHDDLGQHLLALTMEVCVMADTHPAMKEALGQFDNHLRVAVRSLRTIIKDLLPEALESGLRVAVEKQLAQFSRLSGIQCTLAADSDVFKLASGQRFQTMLYRLLQESLSNIARHAQATEVEIALLRQPSCLSLTVRDNGVGMPERTPASSLGSIGQRVAAAGGRLHIASGPGQGTALSMSFPLELAPPQA